MAEIPSAKEIDDTHADDTAAITAMSIKNSLKYTMSLGKKELKEKLEENKNFVEMLGQYGDIRTKTTEDLKLSLMTIAEYHHLNMRI